MISFEKKFKIYSKELEKLEKQSEEKLTEEHQNECSGCPLCEGD